MDDKLVQLKDLDVIKEYIDDKDNELNKELQSKLAEVLNTAEKYADNKDNELSRELKNKLTNALDDVKKYIDDKDDVLNEAINSLSNGLGEFDNELKALVDNVKALDDEVVKLTIGVESIDDKIEVINTESENRDNRINGLENDLNTLNQTVDNLGNDLSNNLNTLSGEVDSLGNNLNTLSGEVNGLNNHFNTLNQTVDNLGDGLDTLSGEVDSLGNNLNTLSGEVDGLGNSLNTLSETVNSRVNMFHAKIDNSNFRYVKDSADFTYEQVVNTENCQIEVQVANEKIYLKKQEFKNINPPDPYAGRYVGFSEMIRVAGKMAELFLFVYDPDNLPTDPDSLAALETWGDGQYCVSSYQPIVMGNFLDTDIEAERNNNTNAPSTKAAGDYTDKKCSVVLDYMQTTFADNIMALVADKYGPHIIYDDPTGFESSNDNAGDTWHLTGLNLSPYKRIKCYVCSGGDGDANYSPEHIVEVHLDNRAKGSFGYFSSDHAGHCPNNRNRHHIVTFTVNAEKTAIQFQHSISLYGTAATNSSGGRRCYLIEGYKY